jgi:hypothetical protein
MGWVSGSNNGPEKLSALEIRASSLTSHPTGYPTAKPENMGPKEAITRVTSKRLAHERHPAHLKMTSSTTSSSAGHGQIRARLLPPARLSLPQLSFQYPLKLISSSVPSSKCLTVFILSYGGGLVSNDQVTLSVVIEDHAKLCLLTQGTLPSPLHPREGRYLKCGGVVRQHQDFQAQASGASHTADDDGGSFATRGAGPAAGPHPAVP